MRGLKLPDMVESLCRIERERFMLSWSETSKVHVLSDLLQLCSFMSCHFPVWSARENFFFPSRAVVTFQL